MKILVTGATGYVGGRLVPRLLAAGPSRDLPGARPRPACRAQAGTASRSDGATCSSLPSLAAGAGGRRRGLLPGALHGRGRARLRGARRARRRELRHGGPRGRRATHHLPRRARRRRGGAVAASGLAAARGRRAARLGRAGHRVSRRRRDRLGQHLVRDDPLSHRAPAGHDHAALGDDPLPADRHRRRARLPHPLPRRTTFRRAHLRDRRPRRADLRRHDAPVRGRESPAALAHPGAGADARACRRTGWTS